MELIKHLEHDLPINSGFEMAMESVQTVNGFVHNQSDRLMPSLIELFDEIPFNECHKWSDINRWLDANCDNLHGLYKLQIEREIQIANVILEYSIKKILQA